MSNVVRLDRDPSGIGLEPDQRDGAITALNFHDVYQNDPGAAATMPDALMRLLKPGGVLGIIDHYSHAGAGNAALHGIDKARVVEAAEVAGFEIARDSDLLANPGDDRTRMVFDEAIPGKTDRFPLKPVKPKEGKDTWHYRKISPR